jgi:hypothetical protein
MSPGRKTALVGAAIVALLLIALLALWKEIVVAYHVSRLRDDPALITTWISERDDSARRIAIGRYARTARGIEVLRRRCLAFVFDLLAAKHPKFLPGAVLPGQIVQIGVYRIAPATSYLLADGPSTIFLSISQAAHDSQIPLLDLVTPGEFWLAEHPGIRFTVWSYREEVEGRPPVLEAELIRHPPPPARAPGSS